MASAGIPRDGDLRPAWGLFTFTPRGWRVQIRRVRYPVRKATQALQDRKVPGAPLLIHKMLECRYRHHALLSEAARRHSGLPPYLKPPPGAPPSMKPKKSLRTLLHVLTLLRRKAITPQRLKFLSAALDAPARPWL